jgi:peptidoglycan/LPS O-acetylase OafA/YrhL
LNRAVSKVSFSQSKASVSLDAMRGLAALIVCFDHFRHVFFVEYHELPSRHALFLIPYLITAAGRQAVIIFFVLSGFLVGGSVLRAFQQNTWTWKQYLIHRFVRLWLVLIPALLLGIFWDSFGLYLHSHLSGNSGQLLQTFAPGTPAPSLQQRLNLHFKSDAKDFFGNLFFVQTILVPPLGSNGPLWSLANEFWYYLLFPLGFFALTTRYKLATRAIFAFLFVLIAFFVGKSIFMLFPLWLMGVALFFVPPRQFSHASRIVASAAYITFLLVCVQLARNYPFIDYLLGLVTAAYIWLLISATDRSSGGAGEAFARGTARFSYTLYLVHMPLLIFLGSFLVHDSQWHPNLHSLLIVFGLACITLLYARGLAAITEFRVDPVKKWAETRLTSYHLTNETISLSNNEETS